MTEQHDDRLTEAQERLLLRYADGECRWLERVWARRLAAKSRAATFFLADMTCTSHGLRDVVRQHGTVDLWSRIETRITQEERAALFLGQRKNRREWQVVVRELFRGGLAPAGAFVAAALLLAVTPAGPAMMAWFSDGQASVGSPGVSGSAVVRAPVAPVNLVAEGSSRRSPGRLRDQSGVEVDWVRSRGRVRVIQDEENRSAIIWVRRPQAPGLLPGEEQ